MTMIRPFSRTYLGRDGAPIVERWDERIFTLSYFHDCMGCTFCHDTCCSYGCDIDRENVARLENEGAALAAFVGSPAQTWFRADAWRNDNDAVGGAYTRTAVTNGACVFLNRKGRGCLIHSYALSSGRDPRILKPMVCSMFPVVVDHGLLRPSYELLEPDLICFGQGKTAYRSARDDIAHYFGMSMVAELDGAEAEALGRSASGAG